MILSISCRVSMVDVHLLVITERNPIGHLQAMGLLDGITRGSIQDAGREIFLMPPEPRACASAVNPCCCSLCLVSLRCWPMTAV
jgi:hypothetical protein